MRHALVRCAALVITAGAVGASCSTDSSDVTTETFTVAYGPAEMQEGDLHVPDGEDPVPVVTLIHGGYWTVGLDRTAMSALADELSSLGYAVWNIDYRRVGDQGGGWPGTAEDVEAALDALGELADEHDLDLDNHAAIGHSAGSQLAFAAAAHAGNPPTALVSLSGVLDMAAASELPDIGRAGRLADAVGRFLGGPPDAVPENYAEASPVELAPLGVPQLVVHGVIDERVPVSQSQDYADSAAATGDAVELVLLREADHFEVMDTGADWWPVVAEWLPEVLDSGSR